MLLLAVRLDRLPLDGTLTAIARHGRVLVPLGALAQALELEIAVDPARGTASGMVGRGRRVSLDLESGAARSDGRPLALDSLAAECHRDDIYLDAKWLSRWLPLDLEVDSRALALAVHPREPLPLQLRQQRMTLAQHALASSMADAGPTVSVSAPYRPWALPALDLALQWLPPRRFLPGRLDQSSAASGDFLWLETRAYTSGDQIQPFRDARFTSGRREPEPRLLGRLHAREFAFGEVSDAGIDLISVPGAGGGAQISSFPLESSGEERRTFRGELPAGWDVEAYRNDVLIGYQPPGATGTYEFRDVPLEFGTNVVRFQFYGPGGETRSEIQLVTLGDAVTPPRQLHYRLSGFERSDGTRRGLAEVATGLAPGFSATVRAAAAELDDRRHDYVASGLRWERGPVFSRADLAVDAGGGEAAQLAATTRLARWTIGLRHARAHAFESEVFRPLYAPIAARTSARLDGEIVAPHLPRLPTSLEWRSDGLVGGGAVRYLTHQIAANVGRLGLTHRLEETMPEVPGAGLPRQRLGQLLVSGGIRRLLLRGGLEYRLGHPAETRTVSFTAETWAGAGVHAAASIDRDVESRQTRAHLDLARSGAPVGLAFRSDYQRSLGLGVSMRLTLGLRPDERTGRWHVQDRQAAEAGAASARVFLDANDDGRMDGNERPLAGATLVAEGAGLSAETDEQGRAFLSGLPGGRPVRLRLETGTLDDPLWVPARPTLAMLPRAGTTLPVDFPVLICGEVSGTLAILRDGRNWPVPGAVLELRDAATRQVLRTVRTAYDGFYDLAGLRPGRYVLALEPAAEARLQVNPISLVFGIRPEGTVLDAANLLLEPYPNPVTAAPEDPEPR